MTDPDVREDGRCARHGCGKARIRTVSKKSGANAAHRALLQHALDADPFCSSTCARAHYGCALEPQPDTRTEGAGESADDWAGDPASGYSLFSLPKRSAA